MSISTVITNNDGQFVALPAEARFPASVTKVNVRVVGLERVIAPANADWNSFFNSATGVTADFLAERACQNQAERDSL